jgi:mannose-6-phosphate isomerase-like protein (cupin superfamily)
MQAFRLDDVLAEMAAANRPWSEFLRTSSLSMGGYRLKAGEVDHQSPHTEDEVYYVISGQATFHCRDEQTLARAGTVLYVERNVEHRFVDIVEDLAVLVFFAPPENSLRGKA